jgi:hypothetical protein
MTKVAGKRAASAHGVHSLTFAREGASVVGSYVTGIDLVVDGGMKVW